jgi:hypothetical protein
MQAYWHAMHNSERYCSDPCLRQDLCSIYARIIAVVENIDAPMLTHLWKELEYRIDVCLVTRSADIERL